MKKEIYKTDWLCSTPVFYNVKLKKISHNINDVIDFENIEIHPEGFNNYLKYGYSIYGQTPIQNVKFLQHSSSIYKDESNNLKILNLDDPVDKWIDYKLSENDIIDLIKEKIQKWEKSVEGEIVIPTSGGYDSRLLNWCIENKERIRSFTYGISSNQGQSYEVIYAKKLSEILGTKWEQIYLGDFHKYLEDWYDLFGVSTHAHGMYHIEFYKNILHKVEGGNPFLSGIVGDVWAGNVNVEKIQNIEQLVALGYNHGISTDPKTSKMISNSYLMEEYWNLNKSKLLDPRFRIIETIRTKMILLCYLKNIPEFFGFNWWSPFLDIDICMAMLNLSKERRYKRQWLTDFFQKNGLDFQTMNLNASFQNTLDLQAMVKFPLKKLNIDILSNVIEKFHINLINKHISTNPFSLKNKIIKSLLEQKKIGTIMKILRYKDPFQEKYYFYNSYLVLYPIDRILNK